MSQRNKNNIFSDHEILDWYDGVITGIGTLYNNNKALFFFNIVAYDFKTEERVFVVLKLDIDWYNKIKLSSTPKALNKNVIEFYKKYSGTIYLLKGKDIDDKECKITEYNGKLDFLNNIQDISDQSKKKTKEWFNFFSAQQGDNLPNVLMG